MQLDKPRGLPHKAVSKQDIIIVCLPSVAVQNSQVTKVSMPPFI